MKQQTVNKLIQISENKSNFNLVFSTILQEKFEEVFTGVKFDKTVCIQFYCLIFESLREIIERSGIKINNEAMNYIAQCYYESIIINQNEILDPNIFHKKSKLENIPTHELILVATLFRGTGFLEEVVKEIKRRS